MRNQARPEGSIAEAYLAEECLVFCSRYLEDNGIRSNQSIRNRTDTRHGLVQESNIFPNVGMPYGKIQAFMMDEKIWTQAHRYVLFNSNSEIVESFRK